MEAGFLKSKYNNSLTWKRKEVRHVSVGTRDSRQKNMKENENI
jgi:hypothetical protein